MTNTTTHTATTEAHSGIDAHSDTDDAHSDTNAHSGAGTSTATRLEHVNLTVADPDATSGLIGPIFGWHVRWSGPAKADGYTVHLGSDDHYLALYRPARSAVVPNPATDAGPVVNGLNHVAVVVDDLDAVEARVEAAGLHPFSHGDYDPGRRFYFLDHDGIEYEVVSYS